MQPARDEPKWKRTRPASAASASARRGARMSIPSCVPWGRGAPKSSENWTVPSTGKTICLRFGAGFGFGPGSEGAEARAGYAAAVPAARPKRARTEVRGLSSGY